MLGDGSSGWGSGLSLWGEPSSCAESGSPVCAVRRVHEGEGSPSYRNQVFMTESGAPSLSLCADWGALLDIGVGVPLGGEMNLRGCPGHWHQVSQAVGWGSWSQEPAGRPACQQRCCGQHEVSDFQPGQAEELILPPGPKRLGAVAWSMRHSWPGMRGNLIAHTQEER